MSKEIKVVLLMVAMLSLVGSAQAYTYSWCGTSGDWANPAIWDVMPSPTVLGQATIFNNAVVNVTTPGQGATDCSLGWSNGGATVNIAAGIEWNVTASGMVGHNGGTAVLNVYGTARFAGLRMSSYLETSSGTINVYNGGLLIAGSSGWSVTVGEMAPAAINLKGNGSMEINGGVLDLSEGRGHIDIEAGQLKMLGDYTGLLQYYVDEGWITSHGGDLSRCVPVVSFLDDYSYVKSTCTCLTYLPEDLNHDCYVDMFDLAILVQNWLACVNPSDANCIQ